MYWKWSETDDDIQSEDEIIGNDKLLEQLEESNVACEQRLFSIRTSCHPLHQFDKS